MHKKLGRDVVEQIFHDNHEDYELIDRGIWTPQGQYEYCNRIFKDQDGDLWKVIADKIRYGFANWYYQYNSKIIQVEQKEIITLQYLPIEKEQVDIL